MHSCFLLWTVCVVTCCVTPITGAAPGRGRVQEEWGMEPTRKGAWPVCILGQRLLLPRFGALTGLDWLGHLRFSSGGLMLKLKLQYFGHLMWRSDSLEKTLMLGKIKGRRRRGWQSMRFLNHITKSMDMILSKQLELVLDRENWPAPIHGVTKS